MWHSSGCRWVTNESRTRCCCPNIGWAAFGRGQRLTEPAEIEFADLAHEPFVALPRSAGALREFWLAMDVPGIVCWPVRGVAPILLAVGWRRDDRRAGCMHLCRRAATWWATVDA